MGAMTCGRSNCGNVMCDRLIDGRYICDDCWEELLVFKKTWPSEIRSGGVVELINEFMRTKVGTYGKILSGDDIETEFRSLVRNNYDD